MKNSFFYIISLSFVLLTTIISCNNDDYSETKCLQIDLLSNQYVQAMFADLQRESFSVNPDGIFEFDDRESLQNVLTIIKYYVEQATDQDTTISINDILSLLKPNTDSNQCVAKSKMKYFFWKTTTISLN